MRIGVGAIVLGDSGEIILLRRKRGPQRERWTLPGGAAQCGETIFEAMQRELVEELGVRAKQLSLIAQMHYVTEDGEQAWLSMVFIARDLTDQPRNAEPDVHDDISWFAISAMPSDLSVLSKRAIEEYYRFVETGNLSLDR